MIIPDLVASFTALTAADLASCDRRALADLVSTSQRVRSWLDAFDGAIAVHAERLAERGACESGPSLLAGGGRRSSRDAEAAARRGAIGELLPSMRGALAAGEVSAGHADAVAKVAAQLDDTGRAELQALEPTLVASAVASSVEAFEREVRDLGRVLSRDDGVGQHERLRNQRSVKRWQDRQTGMCHTHLSLDPEADARVGAAFDAAVAAERARPDVDDRTLEQLRADVLVDLIAGARSTDRRVPEMSVLVDLDTLRRGLHDHSVCETSDGVPVPPATVRRLACEATIVPIVLNSAGVALDVGRQVRVANREQRRALRAMHRTCAHPGCHVRFADCEVHHVVEWTRHGSTDLHNLVPLCSRHHHLVHEGHWSLTLHADRTTTWRRPDGSVHARGSTVDVAPSGVAPTKDDPRDRPRPGETEIPLHLRRAARPPADAADATVVDLARARARALGPPSRAPAA